MIHICNRQKKLFCVFSPSISDVDLIECRDFDMNALKGIICYFSCGLHAYSLNREAKYFEFTQFLVDGAHWQGQKKLKKPDSSSKKGHIGCSDGYNYNLYKKHLGINQQVFQSM